MHDGTHQQFDVRFSPEDAKAGYSYCFSINPKVQPTDYDDGYLLSNCRNWYDHIAKLMEKVSYCDYELFLEVSRQGRLHYHGHLRIRNIGMFFCKDIPKLREIGSYKLSEWESSENSGYASWEDYINKQKEIINVICEHENIPRELNNLRFKSKNIPKRKLLDS